MEFGNSWLRVELVVDWKLILSITLSAVVLKLFR